MPKSAPLTQALDIKEGFMARRLTTALFLVMVGCTHVTNEATLNHFQSKADVRPQAIEIEARGLSALVYGDLLDAPIIHTNKESIVVAYLTLTDTIGVTPESVHWREVIFTRDPSYTPPRDRDSVVRWPVHLTAAGDLGLSGRNDLFSTIPHEQVHAIQNAYGELPRWFSEGMAEWAGLKATKLVAPDLYASRKAKLDIAHKDLIGTPNLKSWGGVRPKPEAILRQITEEQKERMVNEPGYFPPGPFTFGDDDYISDESNTLARYAASLHIFEMIETSSSPASMRAWFSAVQNLPSPKSTPDIVLASKATTGVDISQMLN